MRKIRLLLGETFHLIREHKLYFLSPILILLCLMAILVFHFGPAIVISFIYAGA